MLNDPEDYIAGALADEEMIEGVHDIKEDSYYKPSLMEMVTEGIKATEDFHHQLCQVRGFLTEHDESELPKVVYLALFQTLSQIYDSALNAGRHF